jgi:regulator of protease activity HflC (stomatin/prohibitin superfamily)
MSKIIVCAGCGFVSLIVGIILICVSFQYVEYNQYGLKRNTLTNTVFTNKIYENGRYMMGPSVNMIYFEKDYQKVDFSGSNALSVSNDDGTGFHITVTFFYRIQKENIEKLYNKFGTNYKSKILSLSQSTLKNTAILYNIDDYLTKRSTITKSIKTNVTATLNNIWIDVDELQLHEVLFPEVVNNKYLDAAVQLQVNAKMEYEQDADLIRQETSRLVEVINANETLVLAEAEANYNIITQLAGVNATQLIETAKTEELKLKQIAMAQQSKLIAEARGLYMAQLISNLTMTNSTTRKTFIKLMALLDNTGVKIINTDSSIIIN